MAHISIHSQLPTKPTSVRFVQLLISSHLQQCFVAYQILPLESIDNFWEAQLIEPNTNNSWGGGGCYPYPSILRCSTMSQFSNLVPRPLSPPVLKCLEYAKMEGEGLGERVTCVTSGRREGGGGRCPMKNLEVLVVISKNLRL